MSVPHPQPTHISAVLAHLAQSGELTEDAEAAIREGLAAGEDVPLVDAARVLPDGWWEERVA